MALAPAGADTRFARIVVSRCRRFALRAAISRAIVALAIHRTLRRTGRLYGLYGDSGDYGLLRCLTHRCGRLRAFLFTNRGHRGYGFLGRSRFDWLARVSGSRAFLSSDRRLWLACHGVEMT